MEENRGRGRGGIEEEAEAEWRRGERIRKEVRGEIGGENRRRGEGWNSPKFSFSRQRKSGFYSHLHPHLTKIYFCIFKWDFQILKIKICNGFNMVAMFSLNHWWKESVEIWPLWWLSSSDGAPWTSSFSWNIIFLYLTATISPSSSKPLLMWSVSSSLLLATLHFYMVLDETQD